MKPYYADDSVTLYHGDCRKVTEWLTADVLVTDPPYGIDWALAPLAPSARRGSVGSRTHAGIVGDADTAVRDSVLASWAPKPAALFGAPTQPPPSGIRQTLVWQKPLNAGVMGTVAGFRRDWEAIYLVGTFPASTPTASSILKSNGDHVRYLREGMGHPHAKPVPILGTVILHMPPGTVADPFAGSGSTLVAAKALGRHAIGVEIDERYCETAARRLSQDVLFTEEPA